VDDARWVNAGELEIGAELVTFRGEALVLVGKRMLEGSAHRIMKIWSLEEARDEKGGGAMRGDVTHPSPLSHNCNLYFVALSGIAWRCERAPLRSTCRTPARPCRPAARLSHG
jgi:hypothetical protein